MIPIRPFIDTERAKIGSAAENPPDVQVGPLKRLSSEQRRIFRTVFGQRAIDVSVDPLMVVASQVPADVNTRTAIARGVETLAH